MVSSLRSATESRKSVLLANLLSYHTAAARKMGIDWFFNAELIYLG